uniref:Uncharacterized protein n=1 Tax=Rhizophagus irregularis (strain DAOM 181602 / DAOM 197198 / MUCL 43194) TaxID=747089 RepID=U9T6A4_RHIID
MEIAGQKVLMLNGVSLDVYSLYNIQNQCPDCQYDEVATTYKRYNQNSQALFVNAKRKPGSLDCS